eukprot:14797898-Alexandrium_andersonii.AAC.1
MSESSIEGSPDGLVGLQNVAKSCGDGKVGCQLATVSMLEKLLATYVLALEAFVAREPSDRVISDELV